MNPRHRLKEQVLEAGAGGGEDRGEA